MQTQILPAYKQLPLGEEADRILRSCVHCGFCTATCPTYQLLGDELDSPRGRIYLIKQLLEGKDVSAKTQAHLDRCLTCRSCETTCPSGVEYGHLVDIGRHLIEQQVQRPLLERAKRQLLRTVLPNPSLFAPLLKLGQISKPLLPGALRCKVPPRQTAKALPQQRHRRQMILFEGCVQSAATPNTNAATARVLDALGIELIRVKQAGCCGAVNQHLSAPEAAAQQIKRNIDAWWPLIEQGAEAIVISASGCSGHIKDYAHLLQHDAAYADKAARLTALSKDLSEILSQEDLSAWRQAPHSGQRVAFHSPCTLQHGQKIVGVVEQILGQLGCELTEVADAHLCCGSAGTYSLLQSELSQQLLSNKLHHLQQNQPQLIVTANVGCQLHLASRAEVPVKHWIELVEELLEESE